MGYVHEVKFFRDKKSQKLMIALFDIPPLFCSEFWLKNIEASQYNISSLPTGFKLDKKYSVKELGIQPFLDSDKPDLSSIFQKNKTPVVDEIVRLFKEKVDYNSQNAGLLISQRDVANHFHITISDTHCFNFGGDGFAVFSIPQNAEILSTVKLLNRQQVLDRCLIAYELFKDWDYGFLGWNCEHFSRLVTTGVAVSYQVKESPLAWLNHNGYHPLAQEMIDQAVKNHLTNDQ
ncbi:hypothetical protein M595_1747 [Lyngbya aestuarii BL J]|uniref:LRAT domain-containing protein n=1 Tax=Lyngbya aestuarii BL J TaxID=1348334 RepID=U7QKA7_9CYAN|nr:hypothetical protein [Lyngbya aestuarii]ERT08328.1 hypothetical protein M595_1747 [Lyngbya aestuarii BL J]